MIDIHSHIIPEVDDGSSSMTMSLEMLRMAVKNGSTTIVATPHAFSHVCTYEKPEQLRHAFQQLKQEARDLSLPITILQGAENFFDSRLAEYLVQFPDLLTLNNSDYFLLEFPPDFIFPGSEQFIYNVMNEGFIPIIAHPERNRIFRSKPQLLHRFLQIGALSQVTAGSIRGDFGTSARTAALEFIKHNMVHVIASDAHHTQVRTPETAFVYQELEEFDREHIDLLTTGIPQAIIDNEAVPDTGPMRDPTHKASVFDIFSSIFTRERRSRPR